MAPFLSWNPDGRIEEVISLNYETEADDYIDENLL